jgi:hypothetical protein
MSYWSLWQQFEGELSHKMAISRPILGKLKKNVSFLKSWADQFAFFVLTQRNRTDRSKKTFGLGSRSPK